jgi:hypothetical protein
MKPICSICGSKLKKKTSFISKGVFPYNKSKRETLVCTGKGCIYSEIVETEREQAIREGIFDKETEI